MRLLLDTHIALWAIANSRRLPKVARAHILEPANSVFVSVASVWEISIKHSLRTKSRDPVPFAGRTALGYFTAAGYSILPISSAHAAAIDDLPHHHRDPFDRILIAQAASEQLRLVTHDQSLAVYGQAVMIV